VKLLEMTQANMRFAFEFSQKLATIRSPFGFVYVVVEFTKRRADMLGKQRKWLQSQDGGFKQFSPAGLGGSTLMARSLDDARLRTQHAQSRAAVNRRLRDRHLSPSPPALTAATMPPALPTPTPTAFTPSDPPKFSGANLGQPFH